MTALFAICLVSCNKPAPDDEINIAKQDLTGELSRIDNSICAAIDHIDSINVKHP